MRRIDINQLQTVLAGLPKNPRVLASGNFSTPTTLLTAVDKALPEYVLHMLNAHLGFISVGSARELWRVVRVVTRGRRARNAWRPILR